MIYSEKLPNQGRKNYATKRTNQRIEDRQRQNARRNCNHTKHIQTVLPEVRKGSTSSSNTAPKNTLPLLSRFSGLHSGTSPRPGLAQVTDVGPGANSCGRCVLLGAATGYRPHRLRLWNAPTGIGGSALMRARLTPSRISLT